MIGTYKKTAIGIAELERYTLHLRPELRRLLILIDGKRPVDALLPFFRPDELPGLLDELVSHGAIESASGAATSYLPTVPSGASGRQPLTPMQLRAALAAAKSAAKKMLGSRAEVFIEKIDACTDSQMLRVVVSEVQLKLIADIGDEAATQYVVVIRDAVRSVT